MRSYIKASPPLNDKLLKENDKKHYTSGFAWTSFLLLR